MKEVRIKDICDKGSSNLKQKDVEGKEGAYAVYGASGLISYINTYHQENDYIAIVKDGSGIGRVSFMPAKSSVIGTMQYILPKEGYSIRYIGYCLQSLDLSRYKQGAAIPHIYFRDYGERKVRVSDNLTEQQDIVRYLDESFAKIDALKANAEKSLADAKALFQAELKKAMEPKEGWGEKKLGELAENLRTGLNPRTHFKLNTPDATGYYITVRELKGFTFQVDEKTDRINQHAIERINQRSGLKIGDILYSGTGTIGRTSIVTENPTWWNIKEGVYAITPKAFIDSKYLIYVLRCETIHKRILEKASGTTVKSIPMRELVNITIPLTSLTDQQSIVTHLDALSAKVTQLQQNLEKIKTECDALKQALLKQVFK